MKLSTKAHARITLHIDILGARSDGFRKIQSVTQSISLYDMVTVSLSLPGTGTVTVAPCDGMPSEEQTFIRDTTLAFLRHFGISGDISVSIERCAPANSGLYLCEADCAAVLSLVNRLVSSRVSQLALCEFASLISPDLYFSVVKGTKLTDNATLLMTSLSPLPDCVIAILVPRALPVPNAEESQMLCDRFHKNYDDRRKVKLHVRRVLSSMEDGKLASIADSMSNVYRDPIAESYSYPAAAERLLRNHGALGCNLNAFGASVFGIFRAEQSNHDLLRTFAEAAGFSFYTAHPV